MRNKGFSVAEMLIALLVIGIISAATLPAMTRMSQNKTGIDNNTIKCITANNTSAWYNTGTGATSVPDQGDDPICWAAVTDTQYNRGRAYDTAAWYADHGTGTQPTVAKQILRAACDQGTRKACNYFVNKCWTDGAGSDSPYCDDPGSFLDITYYLALPSASYTNNNGATYLASYLQNLVIKPVYNILYEALHDCQVDENSLACDIASPQVFIEACNTGNNSSCSIAYAMDYNKSCNQIKTAWPGATTGTYKLTYPGDPATNTPVEVDCNMTSVESAAISGCDYATPVPDDCNYGYTNNLNRSCYQLKTEWSAIASGTHNLTYQGQPYNGIVVQNALVPIATCNFTSEASAAITGCNAHWNELSNDCSVAYANNYNRSCTEIESAWAAYTQGDTYSLTTNGAPPTAAVESVCPEADPAPPDPDNDHETYYTICQNPTVRDLPSSLTGLSYDIRITVCNVAGASANITAYNQSTSSGCWYGSKLTGYCDGGTSSTDGCGNNLGNQGGLSNNDYDKFQCTWSAAVSACEAMNLGVNYGSGCGGSSGCSYTTTGWRLPNDNELKSFRVTYGSVSALKSELQLGQTHDLALCDHTGGYGAHYCLDYNRCVGASGNTCWPYAIWSSEGSGYHGAYLFETSWVITDSETNPSEAASVRCIRSL